MLSRIRQSECRYNVDFVAETDLPPHRPQRLNSNIERLQAFSSFIYRNL